MKGEALEWTVPHQRDLLENYPYAVSPKEDGIRCVIAPWGPISQKQKPIPNQHVWRTLDGLELPIGFDGELVIPGASFNDIQSAIMSRSGAPAFEFRVFDWYLPDAPLAGFANRYLELNDWFATLQDALTMQFVKMVPHTTCNTERQIGEALDNYLSEGKEGIMLRELHRPYKCGRASLHKRDQRLIKIKPFEDDEAVIVGYEPMMHNANEIEVTPQGLTKRGKSKENLTPLSLLGKFIVEHTKYGRFAVGTGEGLTMELRKEIWENPEKYMHRTITFKYQKFGTQDRPRSPIFKGFRHD